MDKDFFKGIKIGIGILLVLMLGISAFFFAVGYHSASDIIGGTFNGNYVFNGTMNFTTSTVYGLATVPSGTIIDYNSSSCPTDWTTYYSNSANLIDYSDGSIIGDMTATGAGGISAAFDGETSETESTSARKTTTTYGIVGKDWGVGNTKKVTKMVTYAPNPGGYNSGYDPTITVTLQGSSDNFTSDIHNIGSASGADASGLTLTTTINSSANSYRYHRAYVNIVTSATTYVAEVQFYEEQIKCIKD